MAPFEKLWAEMAALPDCDCRFVAVPRRCGQELKNQPPLDGRLRDGFVEWMESLCALR